MEWVNDRLNEGERSNASYDGQMQLFNSKLCQFCCTDLRI